MALFDRNKDMMLGIGYSSSNMSISGKKRRDMNVDLDLLKDVQDGHN